jgi:response regulator receiver domain
MQIESFLKPQPENKSESLEFFILEDDPIFARLFSKSLHRAFPDSTVNIFENAIDAINALPDGCTPPSVIILDVLLTGPDGFTFLNEIASYSDLSNIPIIIVSSLNFPMQTLESYNVKKILNKATMTPQDLPAAISEILSVKIRSGQKNNLTKNRTADRAKKSSQKLNQEKGK